LLEVPTAREVSDANCRPAEFSHQFCKVPVGTRCALALWHRSFARFNFNEALRNLEIFRRAKADDGRLLRFQAKAGFALALG
jgi:hypothetical protein